MRMVVVPDLHVFLIVSVCICVHLWFNQMSFISAFCALCGSCIMPWPFFVPIVFFVVIV